MFRNIISSVTRVNLLKFIFTGSKRYINIKYLIFPSKKVGLTSFVIGVFELASLSNSKLAEDKANVGGSIGLEAATN